MSGRVRKMWALRAQQLPLEQLASVRARAEQWRNGLTGLTALLAAVTIVKGPSTTEKLPAAVRDAVVDQLTWAFIALLAGSLAAMIAAFGWPASEMLVTGETLASWEAREARRARLTLKLAALCLVIGVALTGWATRNVMLSPEEAAAILAVEQSDGTIVCGAFGAGNRDSLEIESTDALGDKATATVDYADITRIREVAECPAAVATESGK